MRFVQDWEMVNGRIPDRREHNPERPTEGFLYIQDYATTLWGDLLALSFIDMAVGERIAEGFPAWLPVALCFGVGAGIATYFHFKEWMGLYHKPDWAYPWKGKVSAGGKLHTVYFSLQVSVVLMGAWFLVTGSLSLFQALAVLVGGVLYLFAIYCDVKSKRWVKTPPQQGR